MFLFQGTAPVSLQGVSLGGVALDACSSALRAGSLVSGLYSGALSLLQDGDAALGVSDVTAWLVSTDDNSLTTAPTLGSLGKEKPIQIV